MKNKYNMIGISGNARCGKDTLAQLLILHAIGKNKNLKRIAFADSLKRETDCFLRETVGISSFTKNDEEKAKIRPFLVFYGTDFIRGFDNNHWITETEKTMTLGDDYVITDMRFRNEFDWVKSHSGSTIYLERVLPDGSIVPPANNYERENNKELKSVSDHVITWSSFSNTKVKNKQKRKNKHKKP